MSKRGIKGSHWLLPGLALFAIGCTGEDADRLARLGRKAMDRLQTQTAGSQDRLTGTLNSIRGSWNDITLDARVLARIRWDKDLETAEIRARPLNNGAIELTGTVSDLRQRQRAVWLARSTVGVSEVVDKMTVVAPGR